MECIVAFPQRRKAILCNRRRQVSEQYVGRHCCVSWQQWLRKGATMFTLHVYLLTPWCRVLLEKLTGLQLVEKFPAFHGTRRFITALTSVRHPSLSWASTIQSIYPHPTSWRSVLTLSTHLRLGLPSGLFPSGYVTRLLPALLETRSSHF